METLAENVRQHPAITLGLVAGVTLAVFNAIADGLMAGWSQDVANAAVILVNLLVPVVAAGVAERVGPTPS